MQCSDRDADVIELRYYNDKVQTVGHIKITNEGRHNANPCLVFQTDGNLVKYDDEGAQWSSHKITLMGIKDILFLSTGP